MVRLRIALGVASSLVAVAALTIVFAGTGVGSRQWQRSEPAEREHRKCAIAGHWQPQCSRVGQRQRTHYQSARGPITVLLFISPRLS